MRTARRRRNPRRRGPGLETAQDVGRAGVEHRDRDGARRSITRRDPSGSSAATFPGEVGIEALLRHEHVKRTPDERKSAGERLVQNHANAVPVAGRSDRATGCLLGRHVSGSAEEVGAGTVMKPTRSQFRAQTEVEDHDAAIGRDQNVGWLEIPVQPAGLVKRRHPLRQLPQAIPQPVEPGRTLHDHNLTRGRLLPFLRAGDLNLGGRLRSVRRRPRDGRTSRKSTPSIRSIVKNQSRPSETSSRSVTRLGWEISASPRNSFLKR